MMGSRKAFFTSTKGVLLIAITIMAITIGLIALAVRSAYTSYSEDDDSVPTEIWTDALPALFDEKKANHLTHAFGYLSDGMSESSKKHYEECHTSFEAAVDQISAAVGKESPLTCLFISIQATEEEAYQKWPVVEQLEKRLLKSLPKTKHFERMISANTRMLITALKMQGKYDEALQLYEENVAQAQKEAPASDKVRLKRTLVQLMQFNERFQDYNKAFEAHEKIRSMVERQASAEGKSETKHLGRIFLHEAELKRKAHKFVQAHALYDKAASLMPDNAAVYSDRGYMFKHDLHNFSTAIDDYTKAIAISQAREEKVAAGNSPRLQSYSFYFRRAMAYMDDNQFDKARADMQTACNKDPQNSFMLARLAEIDGRSGNFKQALSNLNKALSCTHKSDRPYGDRADVVAAIYMLRGDLFATAGRYQEALADYEQCLLKAPGDARSYINRAAMLEHLGDHQKALTDYNSAQECLAQMAPKHMLKETIECMPEWKERMAVILYEGRAKVYDSLKNKKLAAEDRARASKQEATNQAAMKT